MICKDKKARSPKPRFAKITAGSSCPRLPKEPGRTAVFHKPNIAPFSCTFSLHSFTHPRTVLQNTCWSQLKTTIATPPPPSPRLRLPRASQGRIALPHAARVRATGQLAVHLRRRCVVCNSARLAQEDAPLGRRDRLRRCFQRISGVLVHGISQDCRISQCFPKEFQRQGMPSEVECPLSTHCLGLKTNLLERPMWVMWPETSLRAKRWAVQFP